MREGVAKITGTWEASGRGDDAGINLLHVPYRGSPPALTDLIGGQVHVMFDHATFSQIHSHL
jgi:tripartite-type tricarboxylate transporter receptor subunit TctC